MMLRTLALLPLLLCIPFFAAAQPKDAAKKVTLRWYGQSFFQLETGDGTLVVFDPHAMPEYGRNEVKADLVLVSHNHGDHAQPEILSSKDHKVIHGLNPKDRKQPFVQVNEKFRNVTVRNVSSYHDPDMGLQRGRNSIFVVETDGLKICHLGDLGHPLDEETIKKIGPVDILMVPVGGIYTINGEKAREVVKQLKPRLYIIPMHYGTKALDSLQPPDEFLEGKKNVKKLEDTNALTVPADMKQDEPVIVLMGWK